MKTDRRIKHGQVNSPTYYTWMAMIQRCTNPNRDNYKYYGQKGIRVCQKWETFAGFLADMGPRPEGKTLDRIDSSGNYEKANCRWADKITQARNCADNKIVTVLGETMCLSEACAKHGINLGTAWSRLESGWDEERAVLEPPNKGIPYWKKMQIAQDDRHYKEIMAHYGVSQATVSAYRRQLRAGELSA